jgi:cytochrome c6
MTELHFGVPESSGVNTIPTEENTMRNEIKLTTYLLAGAIGLFVLSAAETTAQAANAENGAAEFKSNCAACHPDGGNTMRPKKTLSKTDREKNGVKTTNDIINKMRKPGSGMTTFDVKRLPEKEARSIAEYIIATFK